MQILVDIINNDNLGDTIIRSRIWIPNCFRIITASLTSVECRSWIIRTPRFLNGRCIKDLDQTNPDENLEVLWLDLLLSLTSFDVSLKVTIFDISNLIWIIPIKYLKNIFFRMDKVGWPRMVML